MPNDPPRRIRRSSSHLRGAIIPHEDSRTRRAAHLVARRAAGPCSALNGVMMVKKLHAASPAISVFRPPNRSASHPPKIYHKEKESIVATIHSKTTMKQADQNHDKCIVSGHGQNYCHQGRHSKGQAKRPEGQVLWMLVANRSNVQGHWEQGSPKELWIHDAFALGYFRRG